MSHNTILNCCVECLDMTRDIDCQTRIYTRREPDQTDILKSKPVVWDDRWHEDRACTYKREITLCTNESWTTRKRTSESLAYEGRTRPSNVSCWPFISSTLSLVSIYSLAVIGRSIQAIRLFVSCVSSPPVPITSELIQYFISLSLRSTSSSSVVHAVGRKKEEKLKGFNHRPLNRMLFLSLRGNQYCLFWSLFALVRRQHHHHHHPGEKCQKQQQ